MGCGTHPQQHAPSATMSPISPLICHFDILVLGIFVFEFSKIIESSEASEVSVLSDHSVYSECFVVMGSIETGVSPIQKMWITCG